MHFSKCFYAAELHRLLVCGHLLFSLEQKSLWMVLALVGVAYKLPGLYYCFVWAPGKAGLEGVGLQNTDVGHGASNIYNILLCELVYSCFRKLLLKLNWREWVQEEHGGGRAIG